MKLRKVGDIFLIAIRAILQLTLYMGLYASTISKDSRDALDGVQHAK